MPSSRISSRPRDQTYVSYVSCTGRQVLYHYCHLGSPGAKTHRPGGLNLRNSFLAVLEIRLPVWSGSEGDTLLICHLLAVFLHGREEEL